MKSFFPPHGQGKSVQGEVDGRHGAAYRNASQSGASGQEGAITKSRVDELQFYIDLIRDFYTHPGCNRADIVRFVALSCAQLGVRAPSRSHVYNILNKYFGRKSSLDQVLGAPTRGHHAYGQPDKRDMTYLSQDSCQLCVYQDQLCMIVGFDCATRDLIVMPYSATVWRVNADCVTSVDPDDFIRLSRK